MSEEEILRQIRAIKAGLAEVVQELRELREESAQLREEIAESGDDWPGLDDD